MPEKALAEFELMVMLAIARIPDAYGAEIRRVIEERAERDVSIGALYATLSRLEDKGMLSVEVTDPLPVPGGRSRKLYRFTPAGEEAVERSTRMMDRMREGLPGAIGGGR